MSESEQKSQENSGDNSFPSGMSREYRIQKRHENSARVNKLIEETNVLPKNEWTYLVFDGQKYKIGRSENPEQRIETLKTANPSCKLIAKTRNISEKAMHILFKSKRLDREWFYFNEEDLKKIEKLFEVGIAKETETFVLHHFRRYRKEQKYSNYIIGFGKYKGIKITDMLDSQQISYIKWFLGEPHSHSEKVRNPYAAFKWWLCQLGKIEDVNNEYESIDEAIEDMKKKDEKNKHFKELSKSKDASERRREARERKYEKRMFEYFANKNKKCPNG